MSSRPRLGERRSATRCLSQGVALAVGAALPAGRSDRPAGLPISKPQLVIVFGTTDMNLLIGKGVMLPVVDVKVPIVGFYAIAPYLVMLVHFNLLLQLLLLSRQLHAFNAAVPEQEPIGGLRDRLHIFPYTYYLVGRPSPIVRWLLGIVVGATLLLLPLVALLVLQLRFLAYQDQAVTWAQRVAVWLDVGLVIVLWPVIMDPDDSWCDYLGRLVSRLRQRWRIGLAWAVVWEIVFLTFVPTTQNYVGYFAAHGVILGLLILLGVASGLVALCRWWHGRRRKPEGARLARTPAVRGMPGLLLVVALGVPLPLGLFVLGEWWEEGLLTGNVVDSNLMIYGRLRFLDLSEQVLLAKPAKPELIAQFREGNPKRVKEALKQVEPVNLRGRNLRRADLYLALLPGADLAQANLQGANLREARLQGSDLRFARLYDVIVETGGTALVDLRAASWTPLHAERLAEIRKVLRKTVAGRNLRKRHSIASSERGTPTYSKFTGSTSQDTICLAFSMDYGS